MIEYEKWRLIHAGKAGLADKIEWVSKERGDGVGFDNLSYNRNGAYRYIEVKTTKLGKETPIFFSMNEYRFSKEHVSNYHCYRVFDFAENPRLFIVSGKFDGFCRMEAVGFKGYF